MITDPMKNHINMHPGELLREYFLQPLGITAYRLAKDAELRHQRTSESVEIFRQWTELYPFPVQRRWDSTTIKEVLADAGAPSAGGGAATSLLGRKGPHHRLHLGEQLVQGPAHCKEGVRLLGILGVFSGDLCQVGAIVERLGLGQQKGELEVYATRHEQLVLLRLAQRIPTRLLAGGQLLAPQVERGIALSEAFEALGTIGGGGRDRLDESRQLTGSVLNDQDLADVLLLIEELRKEA
jgi:hypothetical protein